MGPKNSRFLATLRNDNTLLDPTGAKARKVKILFLTWP
jgi:hypothetical protein